MAFNLVIKPIVFADADEALIYSENRLNGLGKRFYNNFLLAMEEIQEKPFTFSYIKNPVRRHLVNKFSYKIFYVVSEETIFIIGLSHTKRSNAFVKRRLKLLE
ncbi:MAG: hypothetical protein ACR2FN_00480 [Chitinophagaceae bacterium]